MQIDISEIVSCENREVTEKVHIEQDTFVSRLGEFPITESAPFDLKITDDEFKKQVSEIKSGKDTPTVIIKATDDASYMNLIDALDEMQICNIGKYVITDIAEADEFLMKNYDAKGELSQNLADN